MAISYPFHVSGSFPVHQSTAHGDHPHLGGAPVRTPSMDSQKAHHGATPPLAPGGQTTVKVVSRHFIQEAVKRAILEQGIIAKFTPSALIAVSEDSVPVATTLQYHLR